MGKVIQAVWRQEFAEPTLQVGIGQESNVTWAYGYVGSELALSGPIMESYTDAVTIWKDAAPDIAAKIETTYGGKLQTV
jgi:hypothetical protein